MLRKNPVRDEDGEYALLAGGRFSYLGKTSVLNGRCVTVSSLQPINASPSVPLRIRLDRAITVRAIAIIGVVLFHAYAGPYGAADAVAGAATSGAGDAMQNLLRSFAAGLPGLERWVSIFFIVAGYFAHRAYQRSRNAARNRSRRTFVRFFIWRRFWRLVPAFWVALLFSYFVSYDHPFTWDGVQKLAVNASLLKTLYPGYFYSINYAHWYVAAQWQLDLLYPVFLYILARRSMGFAVVLAWVASIFFTFVTPHFTSEAYVHYFPIRWWAEWSLGVYLADRHLAGARVFPRPYAVMFTAAAALMLAHIEGARFVEWFAIRILLAAAFECLLLSRSPRHAWERRLAPIGACSYSLYLLHIPVQQLVARAGRAVGVEFNSIGVWVLFAMASSALAIALAKLSAEHVESTSAALGNRLWRRRFRIRHWMRAPRERPLEPIVWFRKDSATAR